MFTIRIAYDDRDDMFVEAILFIHLLKGNTNLRSGRCVFKCSMISKKFNFSRFLLKFYVSLRPDEYVCGLELFK